MKKQAKAKITRLTLRVEVQTVHGEDLEDVLAAKRDDWYPHYAVSLEKMLNEEFEGGEWYVEPMEVYGGLYFDVYGVLRSKIPEVMRQVNDVVRRWDNKHRISKIKPIERTEGYPE